MMNEQNYFEVLEDLNAEYIKLVDEIYNTPEYRMGNRIYKLVDIIKSGIIRPYITHYRNKKAKKEIERLNMREPKALYINPGIRATTHENVAVYTCVTGEYDKIEKCADFENNVDYKLFTDTPNVVASTNWERIPVSTIVKDAPAGNYANRYCKMHPFELLPGYDYSIYVDGNIRIISDVTSLLSIAKNAKTGMAMHRHPLRDSVYTEAQACILHKKGNKTKLIEQIARYEHEGFPQNFGLLEATIIIVDLKNEKARAIMDAWWEEFCRSESNRDQISLPYVIWKQGYTLDDVGDLGNNLRYNPKFRYVGIGQHQGK